METLACNELLQSLVTRGELIPIIAIVFGCGVGAVGIIAGSLSGVAKTRARENTRREIAAYVAEGSITPDDAVAMMNAGLPKWEVGNTGKKVCCK